MITTSPGVWTNQASRLCECWAAMPMPFEIGPRSTIGTDTWPPRHVAPLGRVVDELVHRQRHEVEDLQLDDRAAADERARRRRRR